MSRCIILIGPPGAGKTTFTKNFEKEYTVSADDFFVDDAGVYRWDMQLMDAAHGRCLRRFLERITTDLPVIVDNTNTTIEQIAPYIAISRAYWYTVEVLVFGRGLTAQQCFERNVHGVPLESIEKKQSQIKALKQNWPSFWPPMNFVDP